MNGLTRTSISGNPLSNELDHELLHQNNIGNDNGIPVAIVNNSTNHNEGKETEQTISSHYAGIPNLANFSEPITNSNTSSSSLEGRIALQPRGLNHDIEQASAMLEANRSTSSSSSAGISRTAHLVRKIITHATIQLAATSHDSLEAPKDEKVKSLIKDNELIRDMMKEGGSENAMLAKLQAVLERTQNIIAGGEIIGEGSLSSNLPTHALGSAIDDAPINNNNDWDQHVYLRTPSSRGSIGSQRSNNTSADENELVKSKKSHNLKNLV